MHAVQVPQRVFTGVMTWITRQIDNYAWYEGNNILFMKRQAWKPVGGKLPNAFGLHTI
jgi:hypothetical protein